MTPYRGYASPRGNRKLERRLEALRERQLQPKRRRWTDGERCLYVIDTLEYAADGSWRGETSPVVPRPRRLPGLPAWGHMSKRQRRRLRKKEMKFLEYVKQVTLELSHPNENLFIERE